MDLLKHILDWISLWCFQNDPLFDSYENETQLSQAEEKKKSQHMFFFMIKEYLILLLKLENPIKTFYLLSTSQLTDDSQSNI